MFAYYFLSDPKSHVTILSEQIGFSDLAKSADPSGRDFEIFYAGFKRCRKIRNLLNKRIPNPRSETKIQTAGRILNAIVQHGQSYPRCDPALSDACEPQAIARSVTDAKMNVITTQSDRKFR